MYNNYKKKVNTIPGCFRQFQFGSSVPPKKLQERGSNDEHREAARFKVGSFLEVLVSLGSLGSRW